MSKYTIKCTSCGVDISFDDIPADCKIECGVCGKLIEFTVPADTDPAEKPRAQEINTKTNEACAVPSTQESDIKLAVLPTGNTENGQNRQKQEFTCQKLEQDQGVEYPKDNEGRNRESESGLKQSATIRIGKKLTVPAAAMIILAGIVLFLMLNKTDNKSSSPETSPSVVPNMDSEEATAKKEILISIGKCKQLVDENKKEDAAREYIKAEEILKKGRIAEGERDALWKQLAELKKLIEPNQVSEIPNPTNTEKIPETAVKESEKRTNELAEKEDAAKKAAEEEKRKAEEARLADLEKSKKTEEKKKAEQERQAIEARDKKIIAEFFYHWKTDVLDKPAQKTWEIELPSSVTKDSRIIFTFDNTNDKDIPYPYKKCYKTEEPFIIKQTSGLMDQTEDYLKFSISSSANKIVLHLDDISKIEGNKAIKLKNITNMTFDSRIELQTYYTGQPIENGIGKLSFDSKTLKISGFYPLGRVDQCANINSKDICLLLINPEMSFNLKNSNLCKTDKTMIEFSIDVMDLFNNNKPAIDKLITSLNSDNKKVNGKVDETLELTNKNIEQLLSSIKKVNDNKDTIDEVKKKIKSNAIFLEKTSKPISDIDKAIAEGNKSIETIAIKYNAINAEIANTNTLDRKRLLDDTQSMLKGQYIKLKNELEKTKLLRSEMQNNQNTYDSAMTRCTTELTEREKEFSSSKSHLSKSIEQSLNGIAENVCIQYSSNNKIVKTISFKTLK